MEEKEKGAALARDQIQRYLEARHGHRIEIQELSELRGEAEGASALKQFGYGRPLLVEYRAGDQALREVLHRIRRNAFGREREEDRAAAVWFDFRAFGRLPRHVPAMDMLVHAHDGSLRSIHDAEELLLVTAYRPGHLYADDLLRIRDEGSARPVDVQRAEALAAYLAGIHQVRHDDATLWRRRLRDLVGHGEGIMGLIDSYPPGLDYAPREELQSLEEQANRWRWRLKTLDGRLAQVHGDFHPFNILFGQGAEFDLLDRSRGVWGEPADDVSCLAINYLFFSLQRAGRLAGPFRELYDRFWSRYLALRPDEQLTAVIQPWLAWRALVIASPVWYPTLDDDVRIKLLTLARRVMAEDRFDYRQVNRYLAPEGEA